MIHYFSLVRIINSSSIVFIPLPSPAFRLFRHIRKYMSENESRKKTFISSYSYIYILYICTHINDFKLKEKQYG